MSVNHRVLMSGVFDTDASSRLVGNYFHGLSHSRACELRHAVTKRSHLLKTFRGTRGELYSRFITKWCRGRKQVVITFSEGHDQWQILSSHRAHSLAHLKYFLELVGRGSWREYKSFVAAQFRLVDLSVHMHVYVCDHMNGNVKSNSCLINGIPFDLLFQMAFTSVTIFYILNAIICKIRCPQSFKTKPFLF